MDCVVLKFGGTSVQDAAALRRLVDVVAAEARPRVVVVSALAGVTDTLSEIAAGVLRGPATGETLHRLLERHVAIVREMVAVPVRASLTARLRRRFEEATSLPIRDASGRDAMLAIGELASSDLITAVLDAAGIPAAWIDAHDVIVTDDTFGHARPDQAAIRAAAQRHLAPVLREGRVPVIGGFVGVSREGATTTLGRGGSDYSAALVAAALSAAEIQIWTDVDGVLTSDPRVVPGATPVSRLTFHEAYDLARFGAKVLHWGTLEPAAEQDIPVRVLNSRRPGNAGTTISARVRRPSPVVVGLAHQTGVTVADVRPRGVAGSVRFIHTALEALAGESTRVNVVVLSPSRLVAVAADHAALDRVLAAVDDVADARVTRDAAIVAAVGEGIVGHAPVWSLLTLAAHHKHLESVMPTQSGHALVCVTTRAVALKALAHLHDTFFAPAHA
ncbi:MAG: aspartate kinase [Acidimicrobiia bacterium]|nr:aspartate kinase [Acidimicrobiia bacterium]